MYLDYCATTPIKEEILETMLPYFKMYGNPSSQYDISYKLRNDINNIRGIICNYIGAKLEEEIIFTHGGSEGNNLILKGINKDITTSSIEHSSILNTCNFINKTYNKNIEYINVDNKGVILLNELQDKITNDNLVSIQYANNEIGTIQPIKDIIKITHNNNSIFHTDATQSFSTIRNNVEKENIDLLTMSGHKIGTPKGIGFVYKRKDVKLEPLIHGGKQEYGLIAGTENVPYIIGLGKAIELLDKSIESKNKTIEHLYDYFLNKIYNINGIKLNGDKENRIKTNINIQIEGVESEALINMLNINDIYVSNGSACEQGTVNVSHVLKEIGINKPNSIRISYDETLTKEDINYFINTLNKCINTIKNQ